MRRKLKKILKIIAMLVALLILLLVVPALVLLGSPSLQTALARAFLPENLKVEKFHIGFGGFSMEGARFSHNETRIRIEKLHGGFSPFHALFHKQLHLRELTACNIRIDLSEWKRDVPLPDPEKIPVDKEIKSLWKSLAEFDGLLQKDIHWPPVQIDILNLNGTVLLPGDSRRLAIDVKGKDIRAREDAGVNLNLEYNHTENPCTFAGASLKNEIRLNLSPDNIIQKVKLVSSGQIHLINDGIRESIDIALKLEAVRNETCTGECYRLLITSGPDNPEAKQMAEVNVAFNYADTIFSGDWLLSGNTDQLGPPARPITGGARGGVYSKGAFKLNPASRTFTCDGQIEIEGGKLELFSPRLENLPDFRSKLDFTLTGLTLADEAKKLDRLNLEAETRLWGLEKLDADGSLEIILDNQRTSADFALILEKRDEIAVFDVKCNGKRVFLEHLQILTEAFRNLKSATEPDVEIMEGQNSYKAEPDSEPPWDRMQGSVSLIASELVLPDGQILNDIDMRAELDSELLKIEKLTAGFRDSPLELDGELRFSSEHPEQPYRLRANLSLLGFDVGAFLREARPDIEPVLSATVSANGALAGQAPNLESLPELMTGDFSVRAGRGVYRGLRRGSANDLLGTAGELGGLIGRLSGEKYVEAIPRLISYFSEIEFDEFILEGRRNPDLTIDIYHLLLRNQELSIKGTGMVEHREGRQLHRQPVRLTLHLAAGRPVSRLLDQLNLLGDEPVEGGYYPLKRPVNIRGSVSEPDPHHLWTIIMEAGADRLFRRKDTQEQEDESKDRRRDPLDGIREIFGF